MKNIKKIAVSIADEIGASLPDENDTFLNDSDIEETLPGDVPGNRNYLYYSICSGDVYNRLRKKYRISEEQLALKLNRSRHAIRNLFFSDRISMPENKALFDLIELKTDSEITESEIYGILQQLENEEINSIENLSDKNETLKKENQSNYSGYKISNSLLQENSELRTQIETLKDRISDLKMEILELKSEQKFLVFKHENEIDKKSSESLSDNVKTLAETFAPLVVGYLNSKGIGAIT